MNNKTILVIDDELGLRESIRMLFKNHYDVHCAESVDEGVACVQNNDPSTIILDMRMPIKDGIQALREIRPIKPDVPVIILTGYADEHSLSKAMRLGANEYMMKPFNVVDMLSTVERYTTTTAGEIEDHLDLN